MKPLKEIKNDELHIARRNLPHWQIGESLYFITFRAKEGIQLDGSARDAVIGVILEYHKKYYDLSSAVVMHDHAHIIIKPLKKYNDVYYSLSEILKMIKGKSARKINSSLRLKRSIWQAESFDRIIRDEKELAEKCLYIRNNPVKGGLAEKPDDYPWLLEIQEVVEK
ncbi:MAG: transposase [Nitrospinota bacterium]|nr:transposase [Nitrospinota bacterium]